jgi:hypothetical protein
VALRSHLEASLLEDEAPAAELAAARREEDYERLLRRLESELSESELNLSDLNLSELNRSNLNGSELEEALIRSPGGRPGYRPGAERSSRGSRRRARAPAAS